MSGAERMRSRTLEISKKLDALKGRDKIGEAYKKQRDAEKRQQQGDGREESRQQLEGDDDADGAGGGGGYRAPEGEEGEAPDSWGFDRSEDAKPAEDLGRFGGLVSQGLISNTARAIAEVELEGKSGASSARQILDAAFEFACANEYDEAAELLEVARGRIDREQIERKLTLEQATEMDDECVWALASAYENVGKLTLAVDRFGILKNRLSGKSRMQAERRWAEASNVLAQRLDQVRRYEDAETLFVAVLEEVNRPAIGETFYEEVQLNLAMTLQNMYRSEEAMMILAEVKAKTASKKRRAQAQFVLDVISVGQQATRNEEFHKVWEESFVLPTDSYSTGGGLPLGGGGGKANLQLTESERKFRNWATEYWKERLASPLYYAFLTLFVTWPFAIPVVSILGKMGK